MVCFGCYVYLIVEYFDDVHLRPQTMNILWKISCRP